MELTASVCPVLPWEECPLKGYEVPKTEKSPAVKPGENFVPKVPNIWSALALAIFPVFAVLLIGRAITRAVDGGEGQLGEVVSTLAIVVLIAGLANLGWVAVSITRKVFAASLEIANALRMEHSIIVLRPASLVLKDGFKPRLNPSAIPAVDSNGRQMTITISTDSTGTRIVPTIHEVREK